MDMIGHYHVSPKIDLVFLTSQNQGFDKPFSSAILAKEGKSSVATERELAGIAGCGPAGRGESTSAESQYDEDPALHEQII